MNTLLRPRLSLLLAALAPIILALQPANLDAQTANVDAQNVRPSRRAAVHDTEKVKMNAWTVGLAGGLLEGAPIRLAAEIARVVDDGSDMHVLPIVTRGATENLNSLLYLRGVDTAIINSDALEEYKIQVPGPLIFSRLGINVEKTFIPHQVALEQMRKGEMAAVVFITSKPVDAFVRGRWEPGFKFLPVAYESKLEDYYLPAVLEASEYPNLIKQGERVSTIAVPTVLVAFNWPAGSNRYQRVARFVDYLFSRIDRLQAPGFDPKWRSINLAATVPALARFSAAQEWLDRRARGAQAPQ